MPLPGWLLRLFRGFGRSDDAAAHFAARRDHYRDNARGHASYCLARGRYELALEFHRLGIEGYRGVVAEEERSGTKDDRLAAREHLRELIERLDEFPRLIATREKMLVHLAGSPGESIESLRSTVGHEGDTKFGVIVNQLTKGGWLRGSKEALTRAPGPIADDLAFLRREIDARRS